MTSRFYKNSIIPQGFPHKYIPNLFGSNRNDLLLHYKLLLLPLHFLHGLFLHLFRLVPYEKVGWTGLPIHMCTQTVTIWTQFCFRYFCFWHEGTRNYILLFIPSGWIENGAFRKAILQKSDSAKLDSLQHFFFFTFYHNEANIC